MGKRHRSSNDSWLEKTPAVPTVELREVNERLLISALREQELSTTLEVERARLTVILSSIGDVVLVVDENGMPVLTNAAYTRMMGDTDATIVLEGATGQPLPPEDAPWHRAAHGDAFTLEFSTLALDGTRRWLEANGQPIDQDSGVQGGVVVIRDVSARKYLEIALHHQALHDALTGLPNRILLYDRLDQTLRSAERTGDPFALFVLDLDHFKEVNDTLGHHAGDLLLHEIAARLLLTLRAADTVARMGGDEFAMLLPQTDRDGAIEVAERVRASLCSAVMVEGQAVYVMVSIGIALSPGQDVDAQTLLRQADIAMYEAKRMHSGHAIYTAEPGTAAVHPGLPSSRQRVS